MNDIQYTCYLGYCIVNIFNKYACIYIKNIQFHITCPLISDDRSCIYHSQSAGIRLVRDSSVVRRHCIFLLEPSNVRAQYIRNTADLPHQALGRHISTFRGYRMLLTIRNPYINRFTNHFSIHS